MKKTTFTQNLLLIFSIFLIIYTPLIGSLIKWKGHIPGYGDFPAKQVILPPGFSSSVFWCGILFVTLISLFLLFPTLFGFKKIQTFNKKETLKNSFFPKWFKIGIIIFLISFSIFWGKIPVLDNLLDPFMFVPIWWGVILIIDGIVYKRTFGKSLIANKTKTVVLLAVISSVGWFIFEYLNFFILENWYYPNNKIFTTYGNYVWYMASYTIIFPQVFEIYNLFETIPSIRDKYKFGPKINFSKLMLIITLIIGIVCSFIMGLFPNQLFFTVWTNPVLIIASILGLLGISNIFSPIKNGDWSKLLLIGISMIICGLMWEFVNFGSEKFYNYQPLNPSYWKYAVPYVNKIRLPFSEMPILGYFGYIPYGWVCWLQWILSAKLFGFDENISVQNTK